MRKVHFYQQKLSVKEIFSDEKLNIYVSSTSFNSNSMQILLDTDCASGSTKNRTWYGR
jgi:hypothetical protein